MFSSFNSFTSTLRAQSLDLVSQAQAGLKTVESSIDHAMGIPTSTTSASAPVASTPSSSTSSTSSKRSSQSSSSTSKSSSQPDETALAIASSGGDFFGSFLGSAATSDLAVSEVTSTPSKSTSSSKRSSKSASKSSTSSNNDAAITSSSQEIAPSALALASGGDFFGSFLGVKAATTPAAKVRPTPADSAAPTSAADVSTIKPVDSSKEDASRNSQQADAEEQPAGPNPTETNGADVVSQASSDEHRDPVPTTSETEPNATPAASIPTSPITASTAETEQPHPEVDASSQPVVVPSQPAESSSSLPDPSLSAPAQATVEPSTSPPADTVATKSAPTKSKAKSKAKSRHSATPEVYAVESVENSISDIATAPSSSPAAAPVLLESPEISPPPSDPVPTVSTAAVTPSSTPSAVPAAKTPLSSTNASMAANIPLPPATPSALNIPITPSVTTPSSSSLTISVATPSSSSDASLLERLRASEEATAKLTRLLKIRELQLEKAALESARANEAAQRAEEKIVTATSAAERDRDRLEKKYNELTKQLADERAKSSQLAAASDSARLVVRNHNDSLETHQLALQQKDAQIAAVMEEGAKLQQKQQKMELTIKSLRKDIAAKEEAMKKQAEDAAAQEKKLSDLQAKHTDLQSKYKSTRSDLQEMSTKIVKLEEKIQEQDALISSSTTTVNELRYAHQQTQDLLREKENSLAKLQHTFDETRKSQDSSSTRLESAKKMEQAAQEREENLLKNVGELQDQLETMRADAMQKDATHQAEIDTLTQQLRDSEQRSEELISAVPSATRPLLRQIESLTTSLNASKDALHTLEKTLHERIQDLELQLVRARNEKLSVEKKSNAWILEKEEMSGRCQTLEEQVSELEQTNRTLRQSAQIMQDAQKELQTKHDDYLHQLLSFQDEKSSLQAKMKSLNESERKTTQLYQQEKILREKIEAQLEQLRKNAITNTMTMGTDAHPHQQNGISSKTSTPTNSTSSHSFSLPPQTPTALQSLVSQKEAEIHSLKEINKQLSDEIASLTSQLQQSRDRLPQLEAQLLATTRRHDAACLIIGEKEEELEEMRGETQQIKHMFQQQVEDLLTKLAAAKKQ